MYNELKTLMQDRGKKKKGKSGKVVVEGETKEITPEGTSNRSKGFVVEKGPDGKERRSRFEASSSEPPARPGVSSGPMNEGGRSKGYMMEKDSEGKMRKSEFEASSSPMPAPPQKKSMVGSGPITEEEFEKRQMQKGKSSSEMNKRPSQEKEYSEDEVGSKLPFEKGGIKKKKIILKKGM